MSVGLIDDDAVVACNGVTACDHAINAATAIPIPIVPVEKNSLNMSAPFVMHAIMSQWRFRILPLPPKMMSCETVCFVGHGSGFVKSCERNSLTKP